MQFGIALPRLDQSTLPTIDGRQPCQGNLKSGQCSRGACRALEASHGAPVFRLIPQFDGKYRGKIIPPVDLLEGHSGLGAYGLTHRRHSSRIPFAIPQGKRVEEHICRCRRSPLKGERLQGRLTDLRPGGSLGEFQRYPACLKRIDQGVMTENRMGGSECSGRTQEKRRSEVWLAQGIPKVTIQTLRLRPFKRTSKEGLGLAQQRLRITAIPRQECRLCREK